MSVMEIYSAAQPKSTTEDGVDYSIYMSRTTHTRLATANINRIRKPEDLERCLKSRSIHEANSQGIEGL